MTILDIIQPDNPILRKKAVKVTSFDARFQKLVDDMVETMIAAPGVGLAAPQVAVSQRLIVVRLPDDEESKKEYGKEAGVLYVVANPKIIKTSKEMVEGIEACLSIPGFYGDVDRYQMVVVTGQDRTGKPIRIKAKGWLARVFQHEIDHLDGRLFIDIAKNVWKAKDVDEETADETIEIE
ncbi:MAG: peptide deformylase [Phototrophicales bacterium]|nr:MAG: peptide deformylase [Phototrophicales bacterium]RMG76214.1 MAG: peptide deformylase [Chloroflexota bacterium]